MKGLSKYGVKSLEELDSKDWGDHFLRRNAAYDSVTPAEGSQQLQARVQLIDQYVLEMNRVRDDHRLTTQRSLASLREKRRNEQLFAGKFKALVQKPEFKSRVNEL